MKKDTAKDKAFYQIIEKLEKERQALHNEIRRNAREINFLAGANEVKKRERAAITKLVRELKAEHAAAK